MKQFWSCSECGHPFELKNLDDEIQCPMCGQLQDADAVRPVLSEGEKSAASVPDVTQETTDESLASLEVQPETTEDAAGSTNPETGEAEALPLPRQVQTVSPTAVPPGPVPDAAPQTESATAHLIRIFGPTLLVCVLFLAWVAYDKIIRVNPGSADPQITEAVRAYRLGDVKTAQEMLDRYSKAFPDSTLAKELQIIIYNAQNKPAGNLPLPNQMNSIANGQ